MKMWREWVDYRRFNRLSPADRSIVFYSESRQDWHHLEPLSDFLTDRLSRPLCHVTSDDAPPPASPRRHVFRIGTGLARTWFFQMVKADVVVMTMMDLDNFHLKRSVHPVHYVYVFHNMGSTHMVDHESSYDHYDSIFCVGPHHVAEIRRREELGGLPAKHLFRQGYPRLDALIETARARPWTPPAGPPTILVAPTWGEQSTLHVCGEPLIAALLGAGARVILRPHYQTVRLAPRVVADLVERFGTDPRFRYIDRMGETESLFESDLLISDWSSMAIEYAVGLGKPVLFVDVPPRVRNPRYTELGLTPLEIRIRAELGAVLPLDRVKDAPVHVDTLLRGAGEFRERISASREKWAFNIGGSVEAGAKEIARIADDRAGAGARGRTR